MTNTLQGDASAGIDVSAASFDGALAASGVGIFEYEIATRVARVSATCRALWGFASDAVPTPELALAGLHPADRQLASRVTEALTPGGPGQFSIEHRVIRSDGTLAWLRTDGQVEFGGQGGARAALRCRGVTRDVTQLKRAAVLLLESEARLRLATEAAGLGLWSWEPQSDVVVWENARPFQIIGILPDQPPVNAARFMAEFVHVEDAADFEQALSGTVRDGAPFLFECRVRRTDGVWRRIEFTGKRVAAEGAEASRLIGTIRDVTDLAQRSPARGA